MIFSHILVLNSITNPMAGATVAIVERTSIQNKMRVSNKFCGHPLLL